MGNRQLRFYEHDRLAVIGVPGSLVRMMNAAGTPVCQLGSSPFAEPHLLAIDRANSVLASPQSSAINSVTYCAYGSTSIGSLPVELGFNGEHPEAFGVYLLGRGERGYSPPLRRFISADRASIFLPGNLNAYAYTAGDPINYKDPSGNIPEFLKPLFGRKKSTHDQADNALINASNAYRRELNKGPELERKLSKAKTKDAEARYEKTETNQKLSKLRGEADRLYSELTSMDPTTIFVSTNSGINEIHVNSQFPSTQLAYLETQNKIYHLEQRWYELDKQESYTARAKTAIELQPWAIKITKANLEFAKSKYSKRVTEIRR